MGWVWRDEPDNVYSSSEGSGDISKFEDPNPSSEDRCSTRKIIKSHCKTEEVEPGKFVRKCEKTEKILKECIGRPVEVLQYNEEYTEEEVTDQVAKGSFPFGASEVEPFDFRGLRSDIEAVERSIFGGLGRFFEAAEEMKNGFFSVFGDPCLDKDESTSKPSMRRGIPIESHSRKEASPKPNSSDSANFDIAGLARDV